MTLNAQNAPWLTHIPAVACGNLSQHCQWFSPVMQTKLTNVHFKTLELVWLLLQLLLGFQHFPQT